MLKILIIDDDILTRKGIQLLMPWASHNMEIAGEASNGKEALDFLSAHPEIDLALVDLDMPIMDGTTFIQTASEQYPQLSYVVLTVHTEFEYVQKILRLGAIDYISKTQFDQENFDQILDRIQAGVSKKNAGSAHTSSGDWALGQILSSEIYALVSIQQGSAASIHTFIEANAIPDDEIYEFDENIWIFPSENKTFAFPKDFTNTMLLEISDVYEMTYSDLGKLLRHYVKNQFFYDYRPISEMNHKHAYELNEKTFISDDKTFDHMKKEWCSLNWVHKNALFDKLRLHLKDCRLNPSRLYRFLLNLEMVWNSSYHSMDKDVITLPPSFATWYEVEQWLTSVYDKSQLFCADTKYSNDVIRGIYSAKTYIEQHYPEVLDAAEIARNAGMSYGYFSRCFHDLIGKSFSDYCTYIRIERAKNLLSHSGNAIQSIAAAVGYQDEKYFSRAFKKMTGTSPSDFRKNIQ